MLTAYLSSCSLASLVFTVLKDFWPWGSPCLQCFVVDAFLYLWSLKSKKVYEILYEILPDIRCASL